MDKVFVAFIIFCFVAFVSIFVFLGYAIYNSVSFDKKCRSLGGLPHQGNCYKIERIIQI